jgi:Domain of unknown function (DUF4258)
MGISDEDLHPHLLARMHQRGVSREEIDRTLGEGWPARDAKPGVLGKVAVFQYGAEWQGSAYAEKEVTVYYKLIQDRMRLITVKARYGSRFPREVGGK